MVMRETAELMFSTSLGGTRIIRVPDPASGLTATALDIAANRMIDANPFDDTIGNLVALKRADKVVISRLVII